MQKARKVLLSNSKNATACLHFKFFLRFVLGCERADQSEIFQHLAEKSYERETKSYNVRC